MNQIKNKNFIISLTTILSVILIFTALFSVLFLPALQNTHNLNEFTDDFEDKIAEFDSDIQIVETASVYGNLCGNGNKINYFGAVLVEKESIKDIDALIATLDNDFEFVSYCDQKTQKVEYKYLERSNPAYETDVSGGEYVSIMFFNSSHENSNTFDLAGH